MSSQHGRLLLPNCYCCFFLLLLLLSPPVATTKEWMSASPLQIFVPHNLQLGDEIVGDTALRVFKDADEQVALSLSPASDALSVAPGVVNPGEVFRLFLKDKDSLLNGYTIQLLGVYSGELQEVPLRFVLDNGQENSTLHFEKDAYDFKLASPLLEKEVALVEMTEVVPTWARFALVGPLSSHFSAYPERGLVAISTIPCRECDIDIPKHFSLLLTFIGSQQPATMLNFMVENPRRLRFDNSYETEIEEGESEFKKVVKLKAAGHVSYSLDDPSGLFSVHPRTGMLTVQHPEFVFIDAVGTMVTLNATAMEGEQRARTTVRIRILPKREATGFGFEKEEYKLIVPAGQRMADANLTLRGNWNNVSYSVSEGPEDLFRVTDGHVFYVGEYSKEDERFLLLVLAQPAQSPEVAAAKVNVLVKGIGSHAIQLLSPVNVSISLPAEETPGALLNLIEVADNDGDTKIEMTIASVSARDFDGNVVEVPVGVVELVPAGEKMELRLKSELGDNEWLSLEVAVEAKDAAHPLELPVYSRVEALIVRKKPIRKAELPLSILEGPVSLRVPSNLPEGSLVYQIRTFPSSNISFSLDNESENFNLDELTGIISTNRQLRPVPSMEILVVTARSPAQKASRNFTIEITDNHEKIPQLLQPTINVEVPATAEIGTVVANVTVINDVPVRFAPLEGEGPFAINNQGVVTTTAQLNPEQKNYVLTARAIGKDGHSEATINVAVDRAEALRFSEDVFHFTIMQNIPMGGYVGQIGLAGKDEVKYSIQAEEGEEQLLAVDNEGRVTTREEVESLLPRKRFHLAATDGRRKATAHLELTILPAFDCVPEFVKGEKGLFHIAENIASGSTIGRVQAKPLDPKCELSFFFWDGESQIQETDFARIDPQTGEITSKRIFDFEETPSYALALGLRAGKRQTAQHGVVLIIDDADDHPIVFQQTSVSIEISEGSPVGSLITTAAAVDPDPSQRVYYLLKQDGDEFELDKETGEVRLAKGLDRETEDRYRFEIGASNSPNSTEDDIDVWMTVRVVVRDENDNGPAFTRGHYEALLEKTALPGRTVVKVHAVDPDLSENGSSPRVHYSIADSHFEYRSSTRPMNGFFAVDPATGDVVLKEPITDFVGGVFHLKLQAADGLQPSSKKSLASVRVIIHDESDIVVSAIHKRPELVELADVENVTQSISAATGLRVLVKDVGYHAAEGVVLNKITDLRMVLVDKTYETVPSEKVMVMLKRGEKNDLTVTRAQLPTTAQDELNFPSPLFIVIFIFLLLLLLATVVLALLICHYRARYRREKHNYEDHRIIQSTLEQPYRRPTPPSPPKMPTTEEDDQLGYMSQERKLSVVPDEPKPKA